MLSALLCSRRRTPPQRQHQTGLWPEDFRKLNQNQPAVSLAKVTARKYLKVGPIWFVPQQQDSAAEQRSHARRKKWLIPIVCFSAQFFTSCACLEDVPISGSHPWAVVECIGCTHQSKKAWRQKLPECRGTGGDCTDLYGSETDFSGRRPSGLINTHSFLSCFHAHLVLPARTKIWHEVWHRAERTQSKNTYKITVRTPKLLANG